MNVILKYATSAFRKPGLVSAALTTGLHAAPRGRSVGIRAPPGEVGHTGNIQETDARFPDASCLTQAGPSRQLCLDSPPVLRESEQRPPRGLKFSSSSTLGLSAPLAAAPPPATAPDEQRQHRNLVGSRRFSSQ